MAEASATIAMGEAYTVKATPAGVKFTSSDVKVATIDEATGVVTTVAPGKTEITASKDGKEDKMTLEVKKAILQDVKQTKMNTVEATVKGDVAKLVKDDFKIVSVDGTKTTYINTITADAKKGIVTLVTYADMKDGKEYNVELDGVVKSFKSTDGTVSDVNCTPTTVVKGVGKQIKAQLLDASGVVIDEVAYPSTKSEIGFDIALTTGYIDSADNNKLVLPEVGDTAEVTVTYHTFKYDDAANEVGKIEKKFTIKAEANSATYKAAKYTIDNNNVPDWSKDVKLVNSFSLSGNARAFFYITDTADEDITMNRYTVESGDSNIVLLSTTTIGNKSNGITLVPVQVGKTVLNIKDSDGKIVDSLPIEVTAKSAIKTIKLDKNAVTISTDEWTDVTSIGIKGYDQNGAEIAINSVETKVIKTCTNATAGWTLNETASVYNSTNKTIDIIAPNTTAKGTYTLSVIATDATTEANKSAAVTLTVNMIETAGITSSYVLETSAAEVDRVATKDVNTKTSVISLVQYKNGAKIGVVSMAGLDAVNPNALKLEKVGGAEISTTSTTGVSFNADGSLVLTPLVVSGTTCAKNLEVASYKVTVDTVINGVTVKRNATVKITDSQSKMTVKEFANGKTDFVASGSTIGDKAGHILSLAAPKLVYDGKDVVTTGSDINVPKINSCTVGSTNDDVVVSALGGGKYQVYVKKATANITYQGRTYDVELTINTAFTGITGM